MDEYQGYLKQLKDKKFAIDFGSAYEKVVHPKKDYRLPLAGWALATAVFMIAATVYLVQIPGNEDLIVNYVTAGEAINGSQLINYVFE
jgi:hypothetical protein